MYATIAERVLTNDANEHHEHSFPPGSAAPVHRKTWRPLGSRFLDMLSGQGRKPWQGAQHAAGKLAATQHLQNHPTGSSADDLLIYERSGPSHPHMSTPLKAKDNAGLMGPPNATSIRAATAARAAHVGIQQTVRQVTHSSISVLEVAESDVLSQPLQRTESTSSPSSTHHHLLGPRKWRFPHRAGLSRLRSLFRLLGHGVRSLTGRLSPQGRAMVDMQALEPLHPPPCKSYGRIGVPY